MRKNSDPSALVSRISGRDDARTTARGAVHGHRGLRWRSRVGLVGIRVLGGAVDD